ncbi:hypothetical protein SDC9_201826 [bioreactor metagenome]|uniref:Uncharacterized protein n=1 Tax=bioreactor metagenome TaxID=1076179 RepID=A0A645ISF2_9ZZZZ
MRFTTPRAVPDAMRSARAVIFVKQRIGIHHFLYIVLRVLCGDLVYPQCPLILGILERPELYIVCPCVVGGGDHYRIAVKLGAEVTQIPGPEADIELGLKQELIAVGANGQAAGDPLARILHDLHQASCADARLGLGIIMAFPGDDGGYKGPVYLKLLRELPDILIIA